MNILPEFRHRNRTESPGNRNGSRATSMLPIREFYEYSPALQFIFADTP